jgi:hypothetical protein
MPSGLCCQNNAEVKRGFEGLAPLILFGSEVNISQPARLSDVRFV